MAVFLFALFDRLSRKRVYIFLQTYLIACYILLQLISYILLFCFLFLPTVSTYFPLHQNCLFPYLYFKFACLSNIIKLLFPLRYPIICDTHYTWAVLISAYEYDPDTLLLLWFPLLYIHITFSVCSQYRLYFSVYSLSSIFGCKYYVILAIPCRVSYTFCFKFHSWLPPLFFVRLANLHSLYHRRFFFSSLSLKLFWTTRIARGLRCTKKAHRQNTCTP